MYETNVFRRNRKKTGEKEFGVARSPRHAKDGSVLPLLEALRNTQEMMSDKNRVEEDTPKSDDSANDAEEKTKLDLSDKVDSQNKIAEAERTGNESR